jgi:hypothetical protein
LLLLVMIEQSRHRAGWLFKAVSLPASFLLRFLQAGNTHTHTPAVTPRH